jgi:hypothetical protein
MRERISSGIIWIFHQRLDSRSAEIADIYSIHARRALTRTDEVRSTVTSGNSALVGVVPVPTVTGVPNAETRLS